jgi:hypothetical protein
MTQLSDKAKRLLELKAHLLEGSPLCETQLERDTNSDLSFLVSLSLRKELAEYVKQARKEAMAPKRHTKPRRSRADHFIKTRPSA